jgi:hypothetical protein
LFCHPGCIAARSDAMQIRDRYLEVASYSSRDLRTKSLVWSDCAAQLRAALRTGWRSHRHPITLGAVEFPFQLSRLLL